MNKRIRFSSCQAFGVVCFLIIFLCGFLGYFYGSRQEKKVQLEGCPIFRDVTPTSVQVYWLPPSGDAGSFTFFELFMLKTDDSGQAHTSRGHAEADGKKIYSGNALSFSVSDMEPLTKYIFTVKTLNINNQVMFNCSGFINTMGVYNLIFNPSFEHLGPPRIPQIDYYAQFGRKDFFAHWEPMMMPYTVESGSSDAHTGNRALKVSSNAAPNKHLASQYVFLNQTNAEPLLLSGWSRASLVSGHPDDGYGILMDVKYTDGSYSYGVSLNFATGTHDWERKCLKLDRKKHIESVNVFVVFGGHTGTVWFDDITLTSRISDESEAGCAVEAPPAVFPACCNQRKTIYSSKTPNWYDVSIITQLTTDRLGILEKMVQSWSGPLSAAVYVLDEEKDIQRIQDLRESSPEIASRVDFHLVLGEEARFAFRTLGLYPVNTLRNEAIAKCRTSHALVLDVDFIPNPTAYESLKKNYQTLEQPRTVFVAPAFEMDDFSHQLPRTKDEMLQLVKANKTRQVHKTKWFPAHGPTNYEKWYRTSQNYEIQYKQDYEPYVVGSTNMPRWDERFVGYGFDKVSHTTELNHAKYRFVVLSDVFIIHWEHGEPSWRKKGDFVIIRVWQNYYNFLQEMETKYKTTLPRKLQTMKYLQSSTSTFSIFLLFLSFVLIAALLIIFSKQGQANYFRGLLKEKF
eukprot:TRINITY_DN2856_c0_g1_i1.p1 TRINITY_DN2856_c0_g1~~TRINITY_DN2856_c0_g1_i1.p1  ORF type:complete len:683 (+),score=125.62 TRINITY_DN2856_c0_g1_i1:53-2101(+)